MLVVVKTITEITIIQTEAVQIEGDQILRKALIFQGKNGIIVITNLSCALFEILSK